MALAVAGYFASATAVAFAGYLALKGVEGWGWFLLVAVMIAGAASDAVKHL